MLRVSTVSKENYIKGLFASFSCGCAHTTRGMVGAASEEASTPGTAEASGLQCAHFSFNTDIDDPDPRVEYIGGMNDNVPEDEMSRITDKVSTYLCEQMDIVRHAYEQALALSHQRLQAVQQKQAQHLQWKQLYREEVKRLKALQSGSPTVRRPQGCVNCGKPSCPFSPTSGSGLQPFRHSQFGKATAAGALPLLPPPPRLPPRK